MMKKLIKYSVYLSTIVVGTVLTLVGLSSSEEGQLLQKNEANSFIKQAFADTPVVSPPLSEPCYRSRNYCGGDDDGDDES